MGQYEPNDSRDVTLNANSAPGEPARTGPREDQARAQAENAKRGDKPAQQGDVQQGYGNSRNIDGEMEQDVAAERKDDKQDETASSAGDPIVGETSERPDIRARADASRPL